MRIGNCILRNLFRVTIGGRLIRIGLQKGRTNLRYNREPFFDAL